MALPNPERRHFRDDPVRKRDPDAYGVLRRYAPVAVEGMMAGGLDIELSPELAEQLRATAKARGADVAALLHQALLTTFAGPARWDDLVPLLQVGELRIGRNGDLEPSWLYSALTPSEREVLWHMARRYPHPYQAPLHPSDRHMVTIHIHRMAPKLKPLGVAIANVKRYGYRLEAI